MKDDKFKFYIPCDIEKGTGETGTEAMVVKGIASTADKDSQGEFLDPSGFDLSGFKWINWNHKGSVDPSTIIGEPTKASITPTNQLYIEGTLYSGVAKARDTWALMKALQNSPGGNKLCLSVEGKVIKRASDDKKSPLYNRILKSKITGVAICPVPINGNTWVDFLQKGYTENEDEAEYDDETKKAMTAAAGEDTTSKESVETAGDKKPIKNLESSQTKVFKKSDIFEKIYDQFPEIEIEKAKSVYSLIEKIATMNTEKKISDETISKAFEILTLATEEIAKSADTAAAKKNDDDADDEKKKKETKDKEDVEKAKKTSTLMKGEGIDADIIKSALVKKGYSEEIIVKAMAEEAVTETKVEGLSKGDVQDLIKSEIGGLGKKLEAVTTILTAQKETNDELKKSLEASALENEGLKTKVEEFLKTPGLRKSVVVTKSYSDKFEKSSDGKQAGRKFNLKDKTDRNALKTHVMELSGINKGENFDRQLVGIAQELELTGALSKAGDIQRLQSIGLELVAE